MANFGNSVLSTGDVSYAAVRYQTLLSLPRLRAIARGRESSDELGILWSDGVYIHT